MNDITTELFIKTLIDDFRKYQKEWLTSHNDIEFDRPEEDLILTFLDDNVYYMSNATGQTSKIYKMRGD